MNQIKTFKTKNMIVNFQNPLQGNPFHLVNNNPFLISKPKNGVYIYGLLLKVDGIDQFLPLNVGITNKTFEQRLINEHYAQIITGYSSKEIFDFVNIRTSLDVEKIYDSIKQYDQLVGKNIEKVKLPTIAKNQQILKYLIYFQNLKYFNSLLQKNNTYSGNYNVSFAIDILESNNDLVHKNKIEQMLKIYKSSFYFVFAEVIDHNLRVVESSVKKKINDLNIFTSAISDKNSINEKIKIDLSNIQQNLINLTDEPFPNPLIL